MSLEPLLEEARRRLYLQLCRVCPTDFCSTSEDKAATKVFAAFSPSCKREYVEWIAEAKCPETRDRRITQAIAEGKQRNWKYQNC